MKQFWTTILLTVFAAFFLSACSLNKISQETLNSEPTGYPEVKAEPNSVLVGMYSGMTTYKVPGNINPTTRGITYWLGKKNGKWAVYLKLSYSHRSSRDSLSVWGGGGRPCTINGDEIIFHGSRRVFVSNGEVYYEIPSRGLKPTKLKKVE